jgi:hypothetical protein
LVTEPRHHPLEHRFIPFISAGLSSIPLCLCDNHFSCPEFR